MLLRPHVSLVLATFAASTLARADEPAAKPVADAPARATPASPATATTPAVSGPSSNADAWRTTWYVQSQYESHDDSQAQLRQGGGLLNQDRFLVRRARVRMDGTWEFAAAAFELDANTVAGPTASIRVAEASLQYFADRADRNAPFVVASMGLLNTPFGRELTESPRVRPFMERSFGSRSMFPGEPDAGVRLVAGAGFARLALAVMNGEPLDERTGFPAQDPNGAKDFVARVGGDVAATSDVNVEFGVSYLSGTGTHAGTDATKASVQWRDINEDGVVQNIELSSLPATAATPSITFKRWLVGADFSTTVRTELGRTLVRGEFSLGSNMDRLLSPSDPVVFGLDARQVAYHALAMQDLGPNAFIGFRYDSYDPRSDVFDKRSGLLMPFSQKVRTLSPLVGVAVPHGKLFAQYDIIDNRWGRDATGVPSRLDANTFTLRLQVEP